MCIRDRVEAIAVGNGTASRETEDFLKRQTFNREVQIFIVSEQGASIYSASKDFRPRLRTFIISSEVLLVSSSTVLIPALFRQL